jgi:hypothetical protein
MRRNYDGCVAVIQGRFGRIHAVKLVPVALGELVDLCMAGASIGLIRLVVK